MHTDTVSKLIQNLKKIPANEKKPNLLAWKVLGILPMALGNKDS